jgi:hypothetical protein
VFLGYNTRFPEGHRPEYPKMQERAYTYIDAGTALIGNAWVERRWSAFIGNTMELRHKPDDFFWVQCNAPEYRFLADGKPVTVMELGYVEWSEGRNPFGASLSALHIGTELMFHIDTFVFQRFPGLVRSCRVMNTSPNPVSVSSVAAEILPLGADGLCVYAGDPLAERGPGVWDSAAPDRVVLVRGERGLILAVDGPATFEMFAPDAQACALRFNDTCTLAPGEAWELPDIHMVACAGGIEAAAQACEGLRKWLGQKAAWEAEIAAAAVEEAGKPENGTNRGTLD